MPLPGPAVLAMWWKVAHEAQPEFEDWHSHEHFPERLRIPGFLRATRWLAADGGEEVFVMYELASYEVLSSPEYQARLNAPTPWSVRMMPQHREMVRSQCRVLESRGGSVAAHALTVRLSPAPGQADTLRAGLRTLADTLFDQPGLTGLHLLRHETPAMPTTAEQRIRGGDRVADWVLLACGYDAARLRALGTDELGEPALVRLGAAPGAVTVQHRLSHSALPGDSP